MFLTAQHKCYFNYNISTLLKLQSTHMRHNTWYTYIYIYIYINKLIFLSAHQKMQDMLFKENSLDTAKA